MSGKAIALRRYPMFVSFATVLICFIAASCGGGSATPVGGGGNPIPTPNAVPTISAITPPNASAGSAGVTLMVTGTGFVSTSTVNWNGNALTTNENSDTELTVTIPAADLASASAAQVTVVSPAPGGGTSNPLAFVVTGSAEAAVPGFVYVANGIGVSLTMGNISAFFVDPTTGVLTPVTGSPFEAGASPTSVTVDPSSKFLYEASNLQNTTSTNDITAFTINSSTGALTAVPGSPFISGTSPAAVSVDPTGKFLYTADGGPGNGPNEFNSISEYSIDGTTGALTPISQVTCADSATQGEGSCNAVITDPVGGFLFGSNSIGAVDVFSISTQGTLEPVAGSPFSITMNPANGPRAVTVDPTGTFVYTADYFPQQISALRITPGVGTLTLVPGSPFAAPPGNPSALVVDPLGRFLYVLDFLAGISGFSINPATGALTMLPGSPLSVPNLLNTTPLAVDPSGKLLFVGSGLSYQAPAVYVYAINATTGALTPVPGSPFTVDGTPQAITVTRKVP